MANSKGSSNVRNLTYMGKHSLLPPKCPFPSTSPLFPDFAPMSATGFKGVPNPRDGSTSHQRTSSESQIIEEQPSWLDELLNEPETPVRKGIHRRSSSDSFAYLEAANATNIGYLVQDGYNFNKDVVSVPSWGLQDFEHYKDVEHVHFYKELHSFRNQKSSARDPTFNSLTHSSKLSGSSYILQEAEAVPSTATEKYDHVESRMSEQKFSLERKECSAKPSASEADTKRAKQQFAQRSRVRKLQYIAELERNVQALQAEGSEVSAELEFVNQQHLILSMENKALKQRLENLVQEHLIKYLEHEVLEREIGRLRALGQQQPQPQQQRPLLSHRRSRSSSDVDSQFANLSLKHKEPNIRRDSVTGTLCI